MQTYLKKRVKAFGYAIQGIFTFFRETAHAKIHLLAVIVITILGQYLSLNRTEWCLIVICIAIVLVAEVMNSAIEYVVDLASPMEHPIAGKAKDVAAGGVLLAVIICACVWGMIFLPKIWEIIL